MLYVINQVKQTHLFGRHVFYLETVSNKVEQIQARPHCGDAKLVMRKCGALLNEPPSAESC